MTMNRNHYFLLGLVLFFLGVEFRVVDSLVLTPECTTFLAKRTRHPVVAASASITSTKKTVKPPEWLGWSLASVGAVLVLHSWAMPKPGG